MIDRDEFHDLVSCPKCGKPEYYGSMVCFNGSSYCRICTYDRWQNEAFDSARERAISKAEQLGIEPDLDNLSYWKKSEKDLIFPYYEDGVNYAKDFAHKYFRMEEK